jgi:hypothetical protein
MKALTRISAIALATLAAAAAAQTQQTSPGSSTSRLNDPNEIVCITEHETGSRLRARRVCRTRAEWDAHRADLRANIDQIVKPTFCPMAASDPDRC